jgi:hypothetical protein
MQAFVQMRQWMSGALAGLAMSFGLAGAAAQAAPVFFTSEPAFQSAASGVAFNLESFEGSNQFGGPIAFADFTVTSTGNTVLETTTDQFPTDGTETLLMQANGAPSGAVTFTFSQAINAFAIDVIDFGTAGPNDLTVTTDNGSQQIFTGFIGGGIGLPVFAGVFDTDSFTTVTLAFSDDNDFVIFDTAQFGALELPAPGAAGLLALGLIGIGFSRRRD